MTLAKQSCPWNLYGRPSSASPGSQRLFDLTDLLQTSEHTLATGQSLARHPLYEPSMEHLGEEIGMKACFSYVVHAVTLVYIAWSSLKSYI